MLPFDIPSFYNLYYLNYWFEVQHTESHCTEGASAAAEAAIIVETP